MQELIAWFDVFARSVPVEVFAFVGSVVEEILAPIPAPLVMGLSGSIIAAKGMSIWYLVVISAIASAGKVVGAFVWYYLADKSSDFVMHKVGPKIGVSRSQVEDIGKKLTGKPGNYITLTIIRSIPGIPSVAIDIACGVVNVNYKLFIFSTFFGTAIRDAIYVYLGYFGVSTASGDGGNNIIFSVALFAVSMLVMGFVMYRNSKKQTAVETVEVELDDNEI